MSITFRFLKFWVAKEVALMSQTLVTKLVSKLIFFKEFAAIIATIKREKVKEANFILKERRERLIV